MEVAASEGASCTPKPHDILWYPDGDVVLKTKTHLFKVHKCILSLQSSAFRDLFAFPAVDRMEVAGNDSTARSEKYDGLPLVELGDKGEHLVHLLRTVYERRYYQRDKDEYTSLWKIAALLVLSTKYDFKDIRADAIHQISRNYPASLESFCDVDVKWSTLFEEDRQDCDWHLLFAANKADVDFLLPLLYYACANKYKVEELFDLMEPERPEFKEKYEVFSALVKGKDQLSKRISVFIAKLPDELREINCAATIPCGKVAYFTELDGYCETTDLWVIRSEHVVKHLKNACEGCTNRMRIMIDNKRKQIWEAMPSYFDLPGWDILQKKRVKFLHSEEFGIAED